MIWIADFRILRDGRDLKSISLVSESHASHNFDPCTVFGSTPIFSFPHLPLFPPDQLYRGSLAIAQHIHHHKQHT